MIRGKTRCGMKTAAQRAQGCAGAICRLINVWYNTVFRAQRTEATIHLLYHAYCICVLKRDQHCKDDYIIRNTAVLLRRAIVHQGDCHRTGFIHSFIHYKKVRYTRRYSTCFLGYFMIT